VCLVNLAKKKNTSIPHLVKTFITSASTSDVRIATSALSAFFSPNRLPTLSSQKPHENTLATSKLERKIWTDRIVVAPVRLSAPWMIADVVKRIDWLASAIGPSLHW